MIVLSPPLTLVAALVVAAAGVVDPALPQVRVRQAERDNARSPSAP